MSDTFDNVPVSSASTPDPFIGTAVQTSRRRAYCQILIDTSTGMAPINQGVIDVTSQLDPHLVSLQISDGTNPAATIELDDRDGTLPIPAINTECTISLGWTTENFYRVFTGVIQEIEHGFGRKQGGRRMWIKLTGMNQTSELKSPMQDHLGDGAPPGQMEGTKIPLSSWLSQVFGNGGGSISVHPSFGSIARDYWAQTNESPVHVAQRMAHELGGVFRVENGNNGMFTVMGEGVDGSTQPTILAQWGDNLIGWRVHPWAARSMWNNSKQQFFDQMKGQWKFVQNAFGKSAPWAGAAANYALPAPAPTSDTANQQSGGVVDGTAVGWGRIVINGEPRASFNCFVYLSGARPGVDGLYYIQSAEHLYSRQGYVTWLTVQPWAPSGGVVGTGFTATPAGATGKPSASELNPTTPTPAKPTVNADGSITTFNADGSSTTVFVDGSTETLSAAGVESWTPPTTGMLTPLPGSPSNPLGS